LGFVVSNGFAIGFLCVGAPTIMFLIVWLINKELIADEADKDAYRNMPTMIMGYLMSMSISAIFYREGPSMMSRGMYVTTFGLIKDDKSLHIENNYLSHLTKSAYLAASIAG